MKQNSLIQDLEESIALYVKSYQGGTFAGCDTFRPRSLGMDAVARAEIMSEVSSFGRKSAGQELMR